ncbi:MAG TPA: DUF1801 domain-containing protein [Candidatus Elarobacter sp.]
MQTGESKPKDYDEYASRFPKSVQRLLGQIRRTIRKAAPGAQETISYGMPAFRQESILVYFAAHTNHIGLYPGASGIAAFKKDLAGYTFAKGSVQFPIDEPLPLALVTRIVEFRVKERFERH